MSQKRAKRRVRNSNSYKSMKVDWSLLYRTRFLLNEDGTTQPVLCPTTDLPRWNAQMGDMDARRVGFAARGDTRVSTVFLGVNHGWGDTPRLFETSVEAPDHGIEGIFRYGNHTTARYCHAAWCLKLFGKMPEVLKQEDENERRDG